MSRIPFSGRMHCWFMPVIIVGGRRYVLLRGVNWRGEYNDNPIHSHQKFPWWHVPSSKFLFDHKHSIPAPEETLNHVMPVVREEWPSLALGAVVAMDQDTQGLWGGRSMSGEIEAVTRIALDLGKAESLPQVVLMPGRKLTQPRHPAVWINADSILELPNTHEGKAGVKASPYIVNGEQHVQMETEHGITEKVVCDLRLKESAGSMFTKSFGPIFSRVT